MSLIAIGDVVAHSSLIDQARTAEGYNFTPIFGPMKEAISSRDLASVTQETPLVHEEWRVGGYPVFGTPEQMGDALVDAGFDIMVSATNHTMDQGAEGILDTVRYWKGHHPDKIVLGIHDDPEQANSVSFADVNGIRIAMTDFTYGLNGFVLPEGSEYEVDLLSDIDTIASNVQAAESQADITICFVHMGDEYSTVPSDEQRWAAEMLIDAGADIVIGSHVHVVQPREYVTTPAGNHGVVYYGLGNSASHQDEVQNMLGGAALITIEKTVQAGGKNSTTKVVESEFVPTFCHYDSQTTSMYFLRDYTDDLARNHYVALAYGHPFSVDGVWDMWTEITGEQRIG